MRTLRFVALALSLIGGGALAAGHNASVDFSNGNQGWEGHWDGLYSNIDTSMGADAPAYRTQFTTYAITFVNSTNPDFIGDFTTSKSVSFGLDINVLSMTPFASLPGTAAERDMVLELRDYDRGTDDMPFASVWINLGRLTVGEGWQHLQATISDTSSTSLLPGWFGNGASDANGNPSLPEGVSFTDILKGVDQIAFTTFVPGWGYTAIDFDVAIDNVTVSAVPEPATVAMHAAGLLALAGVARRRRRPD